jgi:hypothetical protein
MKSIIPGPGLAFTMILYLTMHMNINVASFGGKSFSQINAALDLIKTSGIPIRMENATLEDRATLKVRYHLINLSDDNITAIKLRILFFDKNEDYKNVEEQVDVVKISPKSTKESFFYLDNKVDEGTHLAIAVQEVIGLSGVWSVEPRALEEMVKARIRNLPCDVLTAHYHANQTITNEDKAEIYQDTLEQLFSNKDLLEIFSLENKERLILSRENINFPFVPRMSPVILIMLDAHELQRKADQVGMLKFLRFRSVEAVVIYIKVTLEYLNRAATGRLSTPCCGGYVFSYRKESGRWTGKYIDNYRIL